MTDFRASGEAVPIDSVDQLVEELHLAAKPRDRWLIGTEYEKLAVDPRTGRAAPYEVLLLPRRWLEGCGAE